MPSIGVKRLAHAQGLPIPLRMSSGASGCDVAAACETPVTLQPGERQLIPTGFIFEIPHGYEIQVRPRSGLASKQGITVLNTPGTIDSDYRGEVKVLLINLGSETVTIRRGERIAQLVPMAVAAQLAFVEQSDLNETTRGSGGFGHTGV